MAEIPSTTPAEIRAGDTLQIRRSHPDYPASAGWALAFVLVSPTSAHSFAATADGDDFAVDVDAATTGAWPAGLYRVQETVSKAGQRFTVAVSQLRVLPDLVGNTTGLDTRTHARKVLDAIEAWLEAKSPTAASFELAGRKLQNYPLPDLLKFRDRYRAECLREERAAAGLGPVRILVRF